MKLILTLFLTIVTLGVFAQGTSINTTGASPDPSAILDVSSNSQGVLIPRMTSAQRDAINNPANGLVIFNLDEECLNYHYGNLWYTVCGSCTPLPTTADAGTDQAGVSGTSTTLAANNPGVGSGLWSVISGDGNEVIGNTAGNTSGFSGTPGETYVLRWTITNPCGSSHDDVSISFVANYKQVFVTRDAVGPGNFGNVSGADAICASAASAAGLSGTYKAWLSNSSQSAASRLTQYAGEYRLINGTKVADSWSDLTDGAIDNPINIDEYGNTIATSGFHPVYTNTTELGAINHSNGHCLNWSSSANNQWAGGGNALRSDGDWTNGIFADCTGTFSGNGWRLYCFEQ